MKLTVGERLTASGPARQPGRYVVTGVVRETPWYGLYSGKKIFYNFDFTSKRLRETADKEWLDVLLRTIEYPVIDDAAYVAARRAQARSEVRQILGNRAATLWPEPVDLLEIANTRDVLAAGAGRKRASDTDEPVLVFAHPHGQPLSEWQQNVLPLASILTVLAELLAFLGQVHDCGLVLNGLSPACVLVDRADRAHFIGTDMVFQKDALDPEMWARINPPQRFVPGFSAPECFDTRSIPDGRADLFTWASLAYFLLTGDQPERIAQAQGRAWAHFQTEHFEVLERSLRGIPPVHVRDWGEQLDVDQEALLKDWPANVLAGFRLLLHPDARRRPSSVAECRSWLLAAPPPPASAALAARIDSENVRILLDLGDLPPDAELVIRRSSQPGPLTSDDGDLVSEGPAIAELEDRPNTDQGLPVYAVFTRQRRGERILYSMPVVTKLIGPSESNSLDLVENEAGDERLDQPEPPLLGLLVRAFGGTEICQSLLRSEIPVVRGWAIRRLQVQRSRTREAGSALAEPLLWRALRDSVPELRLQAAQGLLGSLAEPDADLVRRVVNTLAGGDLDDAIQATYSLRRIGLSEDAIRRTVQDLEGDRPTLCPVCQVELPGRDRPEHLCQVHGYVDVFGSLLPRQAAFKRLWDRVLLDGEFPAHDRLLELLESPQANGTLGKLYVSALEEELNRRLETWPSLNQRLLECLRRDPRLRGAVPDLLRCPTEQVREVGRELVLSEISASLSGGRVNAAELRRRLDQVCPEDLLEEKIVLCLRLPGRGVDVAATNACLAQLQEERPILCSECRAAVRLADLEGHLRGLHGIFEFRGVRRSYEQTRNFLLAILCKPISDPRAWQTLEAIAGEHYGARAPRRLASWLGQTLRSLDRERRKKAIPALADGIAAGNNPGRLIKYLTAPARLSGTQAARRHLALEVVTRLPAPVDEKLLVQLHPLLGDRQLSRALRRRASAALLQTTGKSGEAAERLLAAFVAGTGKLRAIERLHLLEQEVGRSPAIDAVCAALEMQVRMNCPRCPTQLRRAQMSRHLWDRHRLVLEGRRVRDPWRVIEDWLEDYRLEKDPAILERCRELSRKRDPERGINYFQRLALSHGVEDEGALTLLLDQARRQHACLCPHCYELIPLAEPPLPPMTFNENSLENQDYSIALSERGFWPRLKIEGPDGTIYHGREPGRWLTRNGAMAFLVGPSMLLALVLFDLLSGHRLPLAVSALLAIGAGIALGAVIYRLWPRNRDVEDRLINCAWASLAAEVGADNLGRADAFFLAGLAQASVGRGDPQKRGPALEEILEQLGKLARNDQTLVPHLAVVWRLRFEDMLYRGEDPIDFLSKQVGLCFKSKMPLRYAAELLKTLSPAHVPPGSPWMKGLSNRLPILLCDEAFSAGLELCDLSSIGQAFPELRWALGPDDVDYLASLRLLWSMQSRRPWRSCGPAVTVFELTRSSLAGNPLFRFPDLLFAAQDISLFVCARGVSFFDIWFGEMPGSFEVRENRDGSGSELIIGPHHFRNQDDPDRLAGRLEKWFRFYFLEFLPQAGSVEASRAGEGMMALKARNGIPCPECKKKVLLRPGEVGGSLDEKTAATLI